MTTREFLCLYVGLLLLWIVLAGGGIALGW